MRIHRTVMVAAALAMPTAAVNADVLEFDPGTFLLGAINDITMTDLGGQVYRTDLGGVSVFDLGGDFDNTIFRAVFNPGDQVVGIGWNLVIDVASPSVLSDIRIRIANDDGGEGIILSAFEGLNHAGGSTVTSSGLIDLEALGFDIDHNGAIVIELFTAFDALPGQPEGVYAAGSFVDLRIIPAPGSLALLTAGGLLMTRRRRS